jgi:hypothetical protein
VSAKIVCCEMKENRKLFEVSQIISGKDDKSEVSFYLPSMWHQVFFI